MVREVLPRRSAQHVSYERLQTTRVDAIQPKYGEATGICRRVLSREVEKDLAQPYSLEEKIRCIFAPIVEITRHQEWFVPRNTPYDPPTEMLELRLSTPSQHIEVHTHAVNWSRRTGHIHDCMQDPPRLECIRGNIEILERDNRVLAEDCVTVVTVRIDGVLAVRNVRPQSSGQKFALRESRPFLEAPRMPIMLTENLLEKDDVRL